MSEETTPVELVQGAALEAIKAFRAFLDIAETVVREPGTAATVGRAFADAASSAFRTGDVHRDREEEHEADDTPTGVRRIHLTD